MYKLEKIDNQRLSSGVVSNRTFPQIIREICEDKNIELQSFSHDYIFKLSRGEIQRYLIGWQFSLNSTRSAKIAVDKSATCKILDISDLPHVEHLLFMSPANKEYIAENGNWQTMIDAFEHYKNNGGIVVKDNTGMCGDLVYHVKSRSDLEKAVFEIFSKVSTLALSPFEHIVSEYRVIMLDGESRLTFEKVRNTESGEWRHNLGKGAKAVIESDAEKINQLSDLAKRAMKVLGLRFASVDIIFNVQGEMKIIEINSSVTLNQFANQGEMEYTIAKNIYGDVIEKIMES